ncbi:DUF2214 domain-containing protein [Roseomonas sp. CCTCC AB2023176]|uniref:DUF2214 domain-containing protein n=1 Tax=Roseomonas sp. CCTCC AB2023176 TaxID=3342640 RepID=UPI0035E0C160
MEQDAWTALSEWVVPAALRRSSSLYAAVNAAHIIGIGLLLGAIATLDARLLGAFRRTPVAAIGPPLVRVAGTGLGVAIATGALLFSVRPAEYAANPAFLAKLALVALGLLNVAALRLGPGWRHALAGGDLTAAVRLGAAASLGIWIAAILAGRWIAFVA